MAVAEATFGPYVRVSSTSAIVTNPNNKRGYWHADWPFNQTITSHIPAPYGDFVIHLSSLFMLTDFSAENGGTLIVPGRHRLPHNPSGDSDIDCESPHPNEINVTGKAGSVFLYDSRLWHCVAPNRNPQPRVAQFESIHVQGPNNGTAADAHPARLLSSKLAPLMPSVRHVLDMQSRSMKKTYRSGAIGALMDEYERAAADLRRLIEQIPDEDFVRVVDSQTNDDACRSVQTIMSHVIKAGYGYADYIREQFSIASTRPRNELLSRQESLEQLDAALRYTAQTLEGRWEMSDEEIAGTVIKSRWGAVYDVEGLLEHAIVHILRHRRQIEKFIWRGMITAHPGV